MRTTTARDSIEPVTDRIHDTSWSANLEKPAYADNEDAVVEGAIEAVEHTIEYDHIDQCGCGGHVTKVTVDRGP